MTRGTNDHLQTSHRGHGGRGVAVFIGVHRRQSRQDAIAAKNAAKSGSGARLGASLAVLQKAAARRVPQQSDVTRDVTRKLPALRASQGYVSVSAYGDDLAGLRAQLEAKGSQGRRRCTPPRFPARRRSRRCATWRQRSGLKFLRPTLAMARSRHACISQGDRSLRADLARRESGATRTRYPRRRAVRQLRLRARARSSLARHSRAPPQDIANGDLPRDVLVLKDLSDVPSDDCSDEGRAMMQLIHDVAPGSPQAFYTAFESQEDFAAGIRALADAGSKVIVDDIIYFAEPMFEDGIIAQAVDDVYHAWRRVFLVRRQ